MAMAMAMAGFRSWTVGLLSVMGLLLVLQGGSAIQLPVSTTFSNDVKSRTYLSEPFTMGRGLVGYTETKMEFPTGHIALKGYDAEVVDEEGNSVPLTDVYIHSWLVRRFYVSEASNSSVIELRNDGVCLIQTFGMFGFGSGTRRTKFAIPGPYGIVIGDPDLVPEGYQEAWSLTVLASDTRSAMHTNCLECRCDAYGKDGSLCYDGNIDLVCCNIVKGSQQCGGNHYIWEPSLPGKKNYYFKYTVHWVDWNPSVVPLRSYIIHVTDEGERDEMDPSVGCEIAYDVPLCDKSLPSASCVHHAETILPPIPKGGHVIYAVAYQHAGGMGCTIHGEDGREICNSEPLYGNGTAAGDEAGYIVGMDVCFPQPGSVKVYDGERLRFSCSHNALSGDSGVMGLQYLLVADFEEQEGVSTQHSSSHQAASQDALVSAYVTAILGLAGLVAACGVVLGILVPAKRRLQSESYQPLP